MGSKRAASRRVDNSPVVAHVKCSSHVGRHILGKFDALLMLWNSPQSCKTNDENSIVSQRPMNTLAVRVYRSDLGVQYVPSTMAEEVGDP